MMWVLVALLVGSVGLAIYVRIAPTDVANWNTPPDALEVGDTTGAAVRVIPSQEGGFERLDSIILSTPRTAVLAGSVEDGLKTYVTRSLLFGFPDYTTVAEREGKLILHGRLRFGKADLGVNAKRLDQWLSEL